jgi:hypothetical protein
MNISVSVLAKDIEFTQDTMIVHLEDGRSISVPLDWFPSLRDASKAQLENWRFIGEGLGIHWEDLDEDISVAGLLRN